MSAIATDTRNAVTVKGLRKSFGDERRPRRGRPRDCGGNGLRSARAERRRQDDDRADPVDADSRRRRASCAWRVTTWPAIPDGVRAAIGVTGQFSAVDDLLTGEENLRLMADLNHLGRDAGRRRVAELLDRFDLVEAAGRPVSTYSGGMRRRLDLAMTLVGSPQVIFLDEPTTGTRPAEPPRRCGRASAPSPPSGVTIFLTTQYLDEADHLADRIAVLERGRIVAEGTPDELKRQIPGGHVRLQFADPDALRAAGGLLAARPTRMTSSCCKCRATAASPRSADCSHDLDDAGVEVEQLSIHTPDLDDVFFAITGQPTDKEAAVS